MAKHHSGIRGKAADLPVIFLRTVAVSPVKRHICHSFKHKG